MVGLTDLFLRRDIPLLFSSMVTRELKGMRRIPSKQRGGRGWFSSTDVYGKVKLEEAPDGNGSLPRVWHGPSTPSKVRPFKPSSQQTFTGFPLQRSPSLPIALQMATASTMSSWSRASTVTAIGVGAVVTGVVGYALYFDHRRRTDPQFRKALKRESRKQEKAAKQEAEAASSRQRKAIREAVEKVNEEDLPTDPEEVEKFFMDEVAEGEILCQNRKWPL